MKSVYAIEGLDRLGKSTLIRGIMDRGGFYQTIHFSKPEKLAVYEHAKDKSPLQLYQEESFRNSMLLARSGARIIFDRWHLGEAVYAPLYRGYDGDYVFKQEKMFAMDEVHSIRLILLVENFNYSKHFVSDGDSFDDTKRKAEQELFFDAMAKSIIPDRRIVCVTAEDGGFRRKEDILEEALA